MEKRICGLASDAPGGRTHLQLVKDFILSFDADKDGKNSLTHDFFAQILGKSA
jgi:hypothetical protein